MRDLSHPVSGVNIGNLFNTYSNLESLASCMCKFGENY